MGPYPCDVIGTENQRSIFAEAFSEGPPEGLARSRHPDREQDPPLVLGEEGTLDDYYTLLRYPADGFFTHLVLLDCRQHMRSLRLGPAELLLLLAPEIFTFDSAEENTIGGSAEVQGVTPRADFRSEENDNCGNRGPDPCGE